MRAHEFLNEVQAGAWRALRAMVPRHWPDYVVKDWLYTQFSNPEQVTNKRKLVQWVLERYPVKQWRLETLNLGYHSFDAHTQKMLMLRAQEPDYGSKHFLVPRDAERHAAQANLIKQTGQANQEPIIVIYRKDGYELVEGWHRTAQNVKAFPNGWRGRAWVGYT
jgi:hypothetical protein